jgi:hypothetical protein
MWLLNWRLPLDSIKPALFPEEGITRQDCQTYHQLTCRNKYSPNFLHVPRATRLT